MRISELIAQNNQFFSLEFFPPKDRAAWPGFFDQVNKLKVLNPLFVSVTYGAGGSTQAYTLEIVSRLKRDYGLEPMAHLTCIGASAQSISSFLDSLNREGINNVLALRGDPPQGQEKFVPDSTEFKYASDLVQFIKNKYPHFCLGVAGYPEGHIEAGSPEEDLQFLKLKLDLGGDFVITQLFFDNDLYFDFVRRVNKLGVDKPIIPGILPIMNLKVIKRIVSLCGATIPKDYLQALEEAQEKHGDAGVKSLGIEYAREQVKDLLQRGAPGVHLYTLNKAEACLQIVSSV
ncbi:methylenetetrahydrofolate reductase [NAD(P)H] [Desulfohalobiaceae bacterium Ax17]|uniref:methylenetetrahydrofolate reductase [NAD(P)H] n=1 Tax=Desulfovulcanus ferrireducens TaxID=2831190 RepID=UPI00207BB602|nr:methylenetetrahydrofolate reductase [NAD(P)H] [Desulfovulcanus ferrireducens]MBT8763928.1 methylenetetrahydrofolate reductase [NAD(P)H] [Desulfovulcanus ferrireducens]